MLGKVQNRISETPTSQVSTRMETKGGGVLVARSRLKEGPLTFIPGDPGVYSNMSYKLNSDPSLVRQDSPPVVDETDIV
ncbi:MAG: hypothetical protein ACI9BD_000038 [Candidatus Marinamargulisbacteria bacterium]|jgi:hypothetical protein